MYGELPNTAISQNQAAILKMQAMNSGTANNMPIESEMNYAAGQLQSELTLLHENIAHLYERLNIVLMELPPQDPSAGGVCCRHISSKMALGLSDAASQVRSQNERIQEILQRLAL